MGGRSRGEKVKGLKVRTKYSWSRCLDMGVVTGKVSRNKRFTHSLSTTRCSSAKVSARRSTTHVSQRPPEESRPPPCTSYVMHGKSSACENTVATTTSTPLVLQQADAVEALIRIHLLASRSCIHVRMDTSTTPTCCNTNRTDFVRMHSERHLKLCYAASDCI